MKKIGIITGASSGMGAEFARQLAKTNLCDQIWIIARREDKLQALKEEIKAFSQVEIVPVTMDLTGAKGAENFRDYLAGQSDFEIKLLFLGPDPEHSDKIG